MPNELPQVIWESEHECGTRFRIVRRRRSGLLHTEHVLEESMKEDVDAMGSRTWQEASISSATVETLLAALLRELPS